LDSIFRFLGVSLTEIKHKNRRKNKRTQKAQNSAFNPKLGHNLSPLNILPTIRLYHNGFKLQAFCKICASKFSNKKASRSSLQELNSKNNHLVTIFYVAALEVWRCLIQETPTSWNSVYHEPAEPLQYALASKIPAHNPTLEPLNHPIPNEHGREAGLLPALLGLGRRNERLNDGQNLV
jgi:hypothetical protein